MSPFLICSLLSPLLPIVVGFKTRSSALWWYCLTAFCFDITGTLLKRVFLVNHLVVGNIFLVVEFLFLSFIFKRAVFGKRSLLFFVWLAGVVAVYALMSVRTFQTFNLTSASIFYFVYVIYVLLGFLYILKMSEVILLERSWFFWVCVAFGLYSSGDFLLFLFRNYIVENNSDLMSKLWTYLFLTSNILKNLLLGIAIYWHVKPRHEPR